MYFAGSGGKQSWRIDGGSRRDSRRIARGAKRPMRAGRTSSAPPTSIRESRLLALRCFDLLRQRLHASDGAEVFEQNDINLGDPSPSGGDVCRDGHYFQLDCLSSTNVDDRIKLSPRLTAPVVGMNRSLVRVRRFLSMEYAIGGVVAGFRDCLLGRGRPQRAAVGINNGR